MPYNFAADRWPVDAKFRVKGVTPTNHSSSQKTRLNDVSYGVKITAAAALAGCISAATDLSSFLSQCTRLTDRWTDRILIASAFHAAQ